LRRRGAGFFHCTPAASNVPDCESCPRSLPIELSMERISAVIREVPSTIVWPQLGQHIWVRSRISLTVVSTECSQPVHGTSIACWSTSGSLPRCFPIS